MSTEDNQFNFFSKDMSTNDNMQIEVFYRKVAEGYNEIILNTAMMLFNWVMGLNTLAIGLTTAVMGNCVATQPLSFNAKWVFISLIAVYAIGASLAYSSGHLEKKRFLQRGEILEKRFDEFQDNKITAKTFIAHYHEKISLDKAVPILEYSSLGCVIIGFIASVFILLFFM
ncbi:MAG: hypothetical protein K2X50_02860 [Gammaproteobacteria bacterium]|nr:hypothetical protein [Gammaproteobacteria bacterium]